MKNLQIFPSKYLVTTFFLLILHAVNVMAAPPDCPNSLQITPVDLQFGDFAGGTAGTVTVPLVGVRTSTNVILAGGAVSPATYTLSTTDTRCENKFITVTGIPTALTLSPGLTVTIASTQASQANGDKFKLVNNSYVVTIGGTLTTDGSQPPGTYNTTFNVNFNY